MYGRRGGRWGVKGSMCTWEEVGKIESIAAMYKSKDRKARPWLLVAAVRKREVTNAICVWEREKEIKVGFKVLNLSDYGFDRNRTI